MGCSRLIVERSVHDIVVDALIRRIRRAVVGDPFDPATEGGPLAHKAQFDKVCEYVTIAEKEGAQIVAGGSPLEVAATHGRGFFHELTLFTEASPTMRVGAECSDIQHRGRGDCLSE
jgi:acyl-CoA reductase-like NAD-dependent aldehyde dehydrogenase